MTWPKLMTVACRGGNNSINENQFWLTNLKNFGKDPLAPTELKLKGERAPKDARNLLVNFFKKVLKRPF